MGHLSWTFLAVVLSLVANASGNKPVRRTFEIQNDRFVKDGRVLQIISGSVHYNRILPAYWKDRLDRLRALGCNTVSFYVPWNFHKPTATGGYVWDGTADLARFLSIADEVGLNVLLRAGPYICGEWDFGGFPWWLATSQVHGGGKFALRSNDSDYLALVDGWYQEMLPRLKPFLYANGGPIIMVQIENELGFVAGPNEAYLRHLLRSARSILGNEVVIYTTDPPPNVAKGSLRGEDVYTVVDFGAGWFDLNWAFGQQKGMNAPGKSPPMCSEFYTGWLTFYGEQMANTSIYTLLDTLNGILKFANGTGSVNFYMAHGGTNFGYTAGGSGGANDYRAIITSYDYDAPISEAGDYGQPGIGGPNKFELIRRAITAHTGVEPPPPPPRPPVASYGRLVQQQQASLLSQVEVLSQGVPSQVPQIMEEYGQWSGLIVYRTHVGPTQLSAASNLLELGVPVHDYATVLIDGKRMGILDRNGAANLSLPGLAKGSTNISATLDIVVEAIGRSNDGWRWDTKGLASPHVALNGQSLKNWTVFPLPLDNVQKLRLAENASDPQHLGPVFYRGGSLVLDDSLRQPSGLFPDTYLSVKGWGKGLAFINGFNLGWYWPLKGPTNSLYIPGSLLQSQENSLVMLEIELAPSDRSVSFNAVPDFFGPQAHASSERMRRGKGRWPRSPASDRFRTHRAPDRMSC